MQMQHILNRNLITLMLSCLSTFAVADNNPFSAMQAEGMSAMMAQMQEIQTCIQKTDQSKIEELTVKAKETQSKIRTHCDASNEAKAKDEAANFAKFLQSSKVLKELDHCLKDLPDMMKGHIKTLDVDELKDKFEKQNVCDMEFQ